MYGVTVGQSHSRAPWYLDEQAAVPPLLEALKWGSLRASKSLSMHAGMHALHASGGGGVGGGGGSGGGGGGGGGGAGHGPGCSHCNGISSELRAPPHTLRPSGHDFAGAAEGEVGDDAIYSSGSDMGAAELPMRRPYSGAASVPLSRSADGGCCPLSGAVRFAHSPDAPSAAPPARRPVRAVWWRRSAEEEERRARRRAEGSRRRERAQPDGSGSDGDGGRDGGGGGGGGWGGGGGGGGGGARAYGAWRPPRTPGPDPAGSKLPARLRDAGLLQLHPELQPEAAEPSGSRDASPPLTTRRRTVASGGCPYKQDARASVLAGTGEINSGTADPMADGRKGLAERGGDGGGDARVSEHAGALLAAAALSWLIASALRGRQRVGGSRLGLLRRGGRARALVLVLLAAAVGALSRSQRAVARLRQLEQLSRPEARPRA